MSLYKKFTFGKHLTKEQVDFFNNYGFLHFENFASRAVVDEIIYSTEQVQSEWIRQDVQKINGVPIKYGVDENGNTIVQRFAFTNKYSEPVQHFASNPQLEALKVLMPKGARIGFDEKDGVVFNHYVNTEGSNFYHMGWHTDSARDIFYGKRVAPMLNIGFYLDDSGEAQGGLRILPGTHKQSIWN